MAKDELKKKLDEGKEATEEFISQINQLGGAAQETFTSISSNMGQVIKELEAAGGSGKDLAASFSNQDKLVKSLNLEAKKLLGFNSETLKNKKETEKFLKSQEKLESKITSLNAQMAINSVKIKHAQAEGNIEAETALMYQQESLLNAKETATALNESYDEIKKANDLLKKQTQVIEGIAGVLKSIPGLGPLIAGPFQEAAIAMREARANSEGWLKSTLKGTAKLSKTLGAAFITFAMKANSETVDMQRNLQMSAEEAIELKHQYTEIANESGIALHNQDNLLESQMQLTKSLGVAMTFSSEQVKNQALLTKRIGVSVEGAAQFAKYQTLTGKSTKESNEEIANSVVNLKKETGIVFKLSDIMDEVAKTNMGLQAAYGFNNELLAKQVINTKKLGLNMAQAEQIASGMLDFEQSIQNELEAELLTGKNLNFEAARHLALQGKSTEAAALMAEQIGSSADLSKMNVIQQESLAKSIGISRNELIASVREKEYLNQLGKESLEDIMKDGEARKKLIALGGEDLVQQHKKEKLAERFEGIVIKIQQRFSEILEGPVGGMVAGLADMLDNAIALGIIVGGALLLGLVSMAASAVENFKTLFMSKGVEKSISKEKKEQLATTTAQAAEESIITGEKVVQVGLEKQITKEKQKQNLVSKKGVGLDTVSNTKKGIGLGMEKTGLVVKKLKNKEEKKGIGYALRKVAISAGQLMKDIGSAAMAALKAFAALGPIGWIAGGIAAAGAVALGMKYMSDGVIGPGGNPVLTGEKGSIQLDSEDSMIVGTDLGGKKQSKKEIAQETSVTSKEQLQEAIKQNTLLTQLMEVNVKIVENTEKLKELDNVGFYEIQ